MTEKKIRVLFLTSWYPTKENEISGIFIQRQVLAVSKHCGVSVLHVKVGDETQIYVSEDKGFLEVIVHKKRKNIILNLIYYVIGHFQGYKIIKKNFGNFDLLHLQVTYPAGIFVFLVNLFSPKPYIISEHSSAYLDADGSFKKSIFIKKFIITRLTSNAKAILVVSNYLKESLEKNKIKNRFYVVPNIVDFHSIESQEQHNQIKRILHISLLNDKEKNVSGILDALKEISKTRLDFRLDIVGDGVDRTFLEEKALKYGLLEKTVFFHGMIPPSEVGKYFSKSDFLITNSRYETFSVSTAESLAYGKPVISTRCGGPEEYIDESNGVLIDVGDSKALVSAIEHMLDNHQKYDQDKIRKDTRNKFSSESVANKILEIYKEALK